MIRQRLFLTATVLALGLAAAPVLAASSGSDVPAKSGSSIPGKAAAGTITAPDCEKLKGAARDACLKDQAARTPGRSEGAAAREGGHTPGRSEDAASRTGVPPGKFDSNPAGAPAAGGSPKEPAGAPATGGSSKDKGMAK